MCFLLFYYILFLTFYYYCKSRILEKKTTCLRFPTPKSIPRPYLLQENDFFHISLLVCLHFYHFIFLRFCGNGSTFVRGLALGSIQFCSHVQTALLPPLSKANSDDNNTIAPSLAAGKQLFLII